MTTYAIYPAIGIARVGNAAAFPKEKDNDFFYGPSSSPNLTTPDGENINLEKFLFKNSLGQIKKQAAQFKIYKYEHGAYEEINIHSPSIESIEWTVHLANQKAAWFSFSNAQDLKELSLAQPFRNAEIANRQSLVVDGKEQRLSTQTIDQHIKITAGFMNQYLNLGEIFLDSVGNLSVLGGNGKAKNINNAPITTFANNDGWIDDISDGTVRATIYLKNGAPIEVAPAHVVITPPNYGQGLNGIVTMYDVIQDLFERHHVIHKAKTDFYQHIYPIFKNLGNMQWVNQGFHLAFGRYSELDFSDDIFLESLINADKKLKQKIFNLFRDPNSTELTPAKNPQFYGDTFGDFDYFANQSLSITQTQYHHLKNWAHGKIDADKKFKTDKFADQPIPMKMSSYHLDSCLGGPFHPGIELTWNLRNLIMWDIHSTKTPFDPFRLKTAPRLTPLATNYQTTMSAEILLHPQGPLSRTEPGALTRYLGVPWHTDEASCLSGYDISQYLPMPSYWGPRVPNQVLSAESAEFYRQIKSQATETEQPKSTHFADKFFNLRQDFYRNFPTSPLAKKTTMIEKWDELGIIAPVKINNEVIFYEKEKSRLDVDPSSLNISEANAGLLQYKDAQHMNLKASSQSSQTLNDSPHRLPSRVLSRDEK